ncbi:hypothetical protein Q1W73_16545 [Asticcacaulis sp. ZE23SCel15]|uniref:hypothetical protein n=1 Tax=Asticcacaulis sp. ZE23SCel15 TaxID=3059027 RepID=UPI00265DE55B|nr:hypothetical protein [Asticcacaulis sp. ZE23SCel15]WKL57253.1 hypothetical protein Q1W73_16545 [Asticcacaulis sp. ZE23SCel15]
MSEIERPFTGVFIPVGLIKNRALSWIDKICLIEIAALGNLPGGCFASNAHFADHLGVSPSRASEIISRFEASGLIDIVYDRNDAGKLSRVIRLTDAGVDLFSPVPSENRSLRKTEGVPSENRRHNNTKDNNIYISNAQAREGLAEFHAEIVSTAGEALASPAICPGVAIVTPLLYLLDDRPDAPACTRDEILDAVRAMAAWYLNAHGAGSMKNWSLVVKKALELRDARIAPRPVREVAKPKPTQTDLGDPRDWPPERWRAAIKVAHRAGEWPAEYGPEPGADGSYAPRELVALWKGGE